MKAKVKVGSSKFRRDHASKRPKKKNIRMIGQGKGYARGNRSTKKQRD